MSYTLGVDLGTTFTAAAVWRDGRAEIVPLGTRAAAIPSVVFLRQDETVLCGEAANRRALTEPDRVAREFKRRLGDPTPLMLGGAPYSAEALLARLLSSVVAEVARHEGGPPSSVTISHPANWGEYKVDLLRQAVRIADLEVPTSFVTEPEAAAVFYAQQERIEPGAVVAVYDLGGGTFDAAVLRRSEHGFELIGRPEGIERLGGIDIDAAVFRHVARALDGKLDELDDTDPAAIAAVARLREECTEAKEALSADTETSIPVLLPNVSTEVRLTRGELEAMVRPALQDTIGALRRALRSAGVTAEQLHSVLLVGGSSRMPIVAQLVSGDLGRPVAVDAHPKHAVALGAAWLASGQSTVAAPRPPTAAPPTAAPPTAVAPTAVAPTAVAPTAAAPTALAPTAAAPAAGTPAAASPPPVHQPPTGAPATPRRRAPSRAQLAGAAAVLGVLAVVVGFLALRGSDRTTVLTAPGTTALPASAGDPPTSAPAADPAASRNDTSAPTSPIGTAGAAAAGTAAAGTVATTTATNTGAVATTAAPAPAPVPTTATAAGAAGAAATTRPAATTAAPVPPDERCTPEIQANPRWVCLTRAQIADGQLTIEYTASWAGATPNVNGGYHLHVYGGDGTTPPAEIMGTHSPTPGRWYVEDQNPSVRAVSSADVVEAIGNAPKVCARIAEAGHRLVPDLQGGFVTGNCVPLRRSA